MAGNNTSEYENSDGREAKFFSDLVGNTAIYAIGGILGTLTLIAFIYGVISWCLIKKFRHFRNYVLLSAIAANGLYNFLFYVLMAFAANGLLSGDVLLDTIPTSVVVYFGLCYQHWLLVLCYIFYVDFVKVFRLDIPRRYLKSSLFSWALPFIVMLLLYVIKYLIHNDNSVWSTREFTIVSNVFLCAPVALGFIIYLFVLYSLFCSKMWKSASTNKSSRFYIATLIFVLSNLSVFPAVSLVIDVENLIIDVYEEILQYLNIIAIDLYIIVMKSNRLVWGEYLSKRSKRTELELK